MYNQNGAYNDYAISDRRASPAGFSSHGPTSSPAPCCQCWCHMAPQPYIQTTFDGTQPTESSKGFFSKNKPPPTPYPGSTSYSAIPPSQTPSGGKPGKKPAKGKEKPAEKPKKSKGGFFSALAEEFVNEFVGQVAEGVAEDAFDGGS